MVELRDYQARAVDSLRAALRSGARRVLVVAPTGSGKTVIGSALAASAVSKGKRVVVIGHRREILLQFHAALERAGVETGIIMARVPENRSAPAQVCSLSTLLRREFPSTDLVIVDEAHRATAETYQRILSNYSGATVIGLTATPIRMGGQPLGSFFERMIEVATYSELIDAGHLAAPIIYRASVQAKTEDLLAKGGDFAAGELAQAMSGKTIVANVLEEWKRFGRDRPTVGFACGVDHARQLAYEFSSAGIPAKSLEGRCSDDERDAVLLDLETGGVKVVFNDDILCEGWDQPKVKTLIMARPTMSLRRYMQACGRVLRPYEGQQPVIIDHGGNVDRFGAPHEDREWSITATAMSGQEPNGKRYRTCEKCYAYTHSDKCPHCGHGQETVSKPVTVLDGYMRQWGEAKGDSDGEANHGREKPDDRVFFDKMVEQAMEKGYKPGWASAQYKEKYGVWPEWSWGRDAKSAFEADSAWQEAVRKRTEQREFWQQKSQERIARFQRYEEGDR